MVREDVRIYRRREIIACFVTTAVKHLTLALPSSWSFQAYISQDLQSWVDVACGIHPLPSPPLDLAESVLRSNPNDETHSRYLKTTIKPFLQTPSHPPCYAHQGGAYALILLKVQHICHSRSQDVTTPSLQNQLKSLLHLQPSRIGASTHGTEATRSKSCMTDDGSA